MNNKHTNHEMTFIDNGKLYCKDCEVVVKSLNYFECLDAIYLYRCELKKKGLTETAINKEALKEFKDELEYCLEYAKIHDIKTVIADYKELYSLE